MADQASTANAAPMYELMYIVNPVLNEDQTKDIVSRVTAFIRENGGDIAETHEMGSQRLAYPIQKKRNGYYVNLWFRHTDGSFIAKFDRAMRINDEIMRHLVLRLDPKMERYYEEQKSTRKETAEAAAADA